MKLEELISRSAIADHLIEPFEDPTINQGCSRGRQPRTADSVRGHRRIIKKVAQQDPKRVAYSPIGIAEAREHLFRKGNVIGVIDAARPQTDQISAVTPDKVSGVHRFVISAGLGNFLAIKVDNEPVGDASLVGRAILHGDAGHE